MNVLLGIYGVGCNGSYNCLVKCCSFIFLKKYDFVDLYLWKVCLQYIIFFFFEVVRIIEYSLQDIIVIGVIVFGFRRKILQSFKEFRERDNILIDQEDDGFVYIMDVVKKLYMNRLIIEFFSCFIFDGNKNLISLRQQ